MGLPHVYNYLVIKKYEILPILILKYCSKLFAPMTKTIQNNPNNK
jgi:hypothetical protein